MANSGILYWGFNSCPVRLFASIASVERKSATTCHVRITARFQVNNDQYHADRKLHGVMYAIPSSIKGNGLSLLDRSRPHTSGGATGGFVFSDLTSNSKATKDISFVFKYWEQTPPTDDFGIAIDPNQTYTIKLTADIPAWTGSGGSGSSGSGSSGNTSSATYTVKKGDTLWAIAKAQLASGSSNSQIQKEVNRLVSLNNIKDPNKIYVGQILKLGTGGGGSSTPSVSVISNVKLGTLSTDDNTLLATWDWSRSDTESYKVNWDYDVGSGTWLKGNHSTITVDEDGPEMAKQSTYSIPSGAARIRFKVKPISKKNKSSNGNESYKWTVGWSSEKIWNNQTPLSAPSAPSVEIEGYKLTATLDNVSINGATSIVFQIVKDNSELSMHTSKPIPIITQCASYSYDINPGSMYKVRCYAYNDTNKNKSDWSSYSSNKSTIPATPSEAPTAKALSANSILLTWKAVSTAKSYDIEYTTEKDHFDITKDTTTETGITTTSYELLELESGLTYFVRVRAVNNEGSSSWSEIASVIVGSEPSAPTTWSSTTTAIVGEPLTLYWVHNTEDGSSQTLAELELTIGGATLPAITIKNHTSNEKKDETRSCQIDTVNGYLRWQEDSVERSFYLGWIIDENVKIDTIIEPANECEKLEGVLTTSGEQVYIYTPEGGSSVYCALTNIYTRTTNVVTPETECEEISGVLTTDEHRVYSYIDTEGNAAYCAWVDNAYYSVSVSEVWYEVKRDHTSVSREGAKIQWRVRTAGITNVYGNWSIQRTVDVYAPPNLEFKVTTVSGNELNVLTSLPFFIYAIPYPPTQTPTGYHLEIVSDSYYETVDSIGNPKTVNIGDIVYSKFFDVNSSSLLVEISAGDVILENNARYTVKCTVSMNSGLTAESTKEFYVAWTETQYEPNAEITIDKTSFTTTIRPYCENVEYVYHEVVYDDDKYTVTENTHNHVTCEAVDPPFTSSNERIYSYTMDEGVIGYCVMVNGTYYSIYEENTRVKYIKTSVIGAPGVPLDTMDGEFTSDGYQVYSYIDAGGDIVYCTIADGKYYDIHAERTGTRYIKGTVIDPPASTCTALAIPEVDYMGETYPVFFGTTQDGDEIYCCKTPVSIPITGMYLSVYRREYDGSFTELAKNLEGSRNISIVDPHPALDFARYRIVATDKQTGTVSYSDLPGCPVGGTSVIVQWDDDWSEFDADEDAVPERPPWAGSLLKLPYNIDVSDSHNPDSELVEYIGRSHPVSYYGTQLGVSSSWNMVIPKSDKETLYGLRRLAKWLGDVYVREPSGSGYWAHVVVSFSQKHKDLTIPVTFNLTRVEGGV